MNNLLCVSILFLAVHCLASSSGGTPNIVILLADNLGYNDISIFGAPTSKTPNIDRLGYEGLKLNHWNSAAHLCSASRAAILTGRYPARMGIYPRVFRVDAEYGLLPEETTLAEFLRDQNNYSTSIVGKWHLGHRPDYLPTKQGFNEWTGVPYHMSGGSLDGHECYDDTNKTMWLPLYQDEKIIEQPVNLDNLAKRYTDRATDFIERNAKKGQPFFLYMAFSHVHQLCAPKFAAEQKTCQWAGSRSNSHTFVNAVEEMDWIAGQILEKVDDLELINETLVFFTSDNGPWVAEQECAGSKGPFEGRWLYDNTDPTCTACPSGYNPLSASSTDHTCILSGTSNIELKGVPCGADTGLGSVWEANLRMPGLVRWPGRIPPGTESMTMMSSLDLVPSILSIVGQDIPQSIDGMDMSAAWLDPSAHEVNTENRVLFFWRDGFESGPLPPPFGRFDVAAVKIGRIKAWLWTKSGHYNSDKELYHDPPLLFDIIADPAEAFPLSPKDYPDLVERIPEMVAEHQKIVPLGFPLALSHDSKYIPCANEETNCRTTTSFIHVDVKKDTS